MNKAELVDALEVRLGGRRQATVAVEAIVELITVTVAKGDKVAISGFGTFEKQARNARTGRNPRTGEAVKIKKTSVPRFRPGTAFKEVVSDTKALRAFSALAKDRAASGITSLSPVAAKTTPAKTTSTSKAAPAPRAAAAGGDPVARKSTSKTAPAARKAGVTKTDVASTEPAKSATGRTTTKRAAAKKS